MYFTTLEKENEKISSIKYPSTIGLAVTGEVDSSTNKRETTKFLCSANFCFKSESCLNLKKFCCELLLRTRTRRSHVELEN